MRRFLLIFGVLVLQGSLVFSQTTYYSQTNGMAFSSLADWNTNPGGAGSNPVAGDLTSGTCTFIVQDGHTVTLNMDADVSALSVGTGTSGMFTIGNDATARNLTIRDNFVITNGATVNVGAFTATHILNINSSITNDGTLNLQTSFSQTARVNFAPPTPINLSGSGPWTFGNVSFVSGYVTASANLNIAGSVAIGAAGATFDDGGLNHNVAGNWSDAGGTHTGGGTIAFNGAFAQQISTTSEFNNLTLSNSGSATLPFNLTITGNFTITGTKQVTSDATHTISGNFTVGAGCKYDQSAGGTVILNSTSAQTITIDPAATACIFNNLYLRNGGSGNPKTIVGNSTTIGTMYVYTTAEVTGTGTHNIDNLRMEGTCGFSGTINFTGGTIYDNNDDDLSLGTALINVVGGTNIQAGDLVRVSNNFDVSGANFRINLGSELRQLVGGKTFHLADTRILTILGSDNFPNNFATITLDSLSETRYDAAPFDQTVRGNITYGQLQVSNGGPAFNKIVDGPIIVKSTLDLNNDAILQLQNFDHIITGNVTNGSSCQLISSFPGKVTFNCQDGNQYIYPGTGMYVFNDIEFTCSAPTAVRTKFIQQDVFVMGNFTATSNGDSAVTYTVIDIDDHVINGGGGNISIGANVHLYTSGANNFSSSMIGFAGKSFAQSSIVRFDGVVDQEIPNGFTYGSIEIRQNSNKTALGNLDVNGYFMRIYETPVFVDGGFSHTVAGNWMMAQAFATVASMTGTMTFDGPNQDISASCFHNVVFAGTGTKDILAGAGLDISGDLTIENGSSVNAFERVINIEGNWTQNGTGIFTQTETWTTFDGTAGDQTITIATPATSYFGNLAISKNNTTDLIAGSDFYILRTLTFTENQANFDLNGKTLYVGRNYNFYNGCTFTPNLGTVVFNGTSIDQDIVNRTTVASALNFYNVTFTGTATKLFSVTTGGSYMDIDGNFNNSSTFNGSNYYIYLAGNWTNTGTFQHNSRVVFDGGNQNISSSMFHDIEFAGTNTKTLLGAITLSGWLQINAGSTLDVGANNSISVDETWINNLGGTFLCKQGIVTFNGGNAYLYPGGVGAGHQFYDVVVAKNTGNWANIPNGEGGMDIENNFTVQSGTFTTNDNNINIAGSLDVNATFNHNNNSSMLTFDATSGTHTIKSYNNNLRNITIDAPGAIYNLSDDLNMYRPCNLDIVNGKLGLNGKTLIFGENSGAAAGDIYVRAGAELDVNAGSSINFYSRTGELHNFGTLYLVGESGNPAYLTSAQTTAAYLYNVINYSGSTLHANYYMVEKSGFSGIELQSGSTIDATDNFSNGQFSSGGGTAYLTLTDADMGAGITVTGVSFGTGPTYNVNRTVGNGAITFENSTGTFTGEANDNDDADPGTKVMWTFPGGFYWDAGDLTDNTDWNRAANWLGNTVPDGTATAYLEHTTGGVAGAYTVNIQSADATVKILTLDAEGGNAIDLVLNGHTLDITQDIIIGTNTSVTQTTANDTIRVAGNWQEIGTYTPNSGTILFNGTGGTSNIQATSSFNNIVFNASGATYNLSQNTDVNGDVRIWAGTLGGGSYTMTVAGDWQKTNGIFDAATSTVSFDKTGTTTQTISGGVFFNFTTDNSGGGTATKQILSTIVINNDVTIGANTILDGTTKNITVGRHWTNNAGLAGFSQTGVGRVSFNGDVNQTIGNGGLATTFNNIVISGTAGTKTIDRDMNVNGDLSIDNIRVNINTDYLIDGTGPSNTFSMSSGTMFVYGGTNLFPAKGVNHNFPVNMEIINISGGTVYYQADINQDVYPTTYNNIDFRRIAAVDQTKTLTGNITVLGNININDVNTELNVNDFTIFLTGNIAVPTGGKAIDWGSPAPTCTGTLQHEGANWNMDADIAQYNNLILAGTGDKAMLANVTITGNVTVLNGVDIWMSQTNWNNPRTMTCTSAGKSFSLIGDSRLLNATDAGTAVAFPTGFATYSLDVASIVYLDRAAAQTIFTNGGTMTYGNLYVYTNGTATCDGMLDVDGDFLMDDAAVFADGGFNLYFAGANCDFRGYPVPTSTTTFNGPDQSIRNDDGGTNPDNMYFKNLVFAGTGTKTFTNGQDVVYISGNLTVNNSITVDCSGNVSDIHFTGTTWTNNGTFNKTNATVFFEGAGVQNINPGANHSFNAVTFSNGGASAKTIVNNPLNVEYGNFTVDAGATLDMGTFTHTIASVTVANGGTWITNNCNLIFDRDNGNQSICALTAKDVTITPNGSAIGRTKTLTGNWVIDDLTIETNSTLDANNGGNYSITLTGNWTNSGGSFTARAGTVAFESNDGTGKTITSNGSNFFTLNFNQSQTNARIYTMADNFGTNGNLTAGNGATLFLNGKTLTLGDNTGIETHTIQAGGTLYANANATIAVNTNAGHAPLNVSGTLKVIGTSGNNAIIDRSAGGNRIAVTIAAGATIAAEYYHFKYLVDAGMVIVTTATIDDTYNLSNGTWSEMNTAGVQTRYYLDAECSPPSTPIENVTFNYSGTPVIGRHHNVVRRLAGTTLAFDGTISGSLAGETWEADGPAEGTVTPGRITWPAVSEVQWNGSVGADWFDPINWTPNTVPTEFIDAKIPYVSPNDYPKIWAPDAKCRRLRLTNGMLLLTGGFDLAVYSDAIIGESGGAATLAITDPGCEIIVAGSWTKDPAATFNAGGGRVLFVAATGSATITPGSSPFYDIQFNGGATFNIVGAAVDVYHNFTISSGNVTISTGNYNLTIGGDYDNPGGTFSTSTAGTVTFGGADQSITNGTFYNLVIGGTGEKTAYNMLSTANTLVVNSTLTADNGSACSIDINGDATIAGTGTFNDGNQTHYFSGRNWYGTGAYTGSGTVIFDRGNTNSVIIYPSKFNNLTLGCLGSVTLAGDVDVTGDVTVTDSINVFYLSTYLLSSTNGLGTFSLINNEILDVRGADNFPDNFGAYELDTNTYTRYYGTIDQIVAGVGYGNLQLSNVKKRTLDGDITIKGSLWFNNSTLDVSSSNYKISIAGDWNNNSTGSFLCKNGQVVFNGNVYQTIRINGSGTQTFYRFTVDKGGNSTAVINYHATILDFLRVLNGNLNTQDLVVRVGGDILCTSGKILTNNSINSRFILNKSSGSASISTNGSIFRNIDIDAGTTVFTLQDGLTVEMNFNLISGTFDGNGKTVEMSSNGFGCTISGTYKVGNNGTLKIGQNVTFTVASGGSFYAVGTPGIATVTNRAGTQRYTFVVDGTIYAEDYLIEYLAAGGLRISSTGLVDLANNFSNGTFTNGASGGTYLTFESNQAIDGANRIENVSFNYNPLGGAHNVTKTASDIGVVEFYNSSGVFAGEDFDYENVDVIVWTGAVTVSWIGVIDEDWYKSGNWSASSGPAHVPLITDDVIINFIGPPQQPEIHQGGAVAKSIYLSNNATLYLNTPADEANDLEVAGDIDNFGTISCASATDTIIVGGNWTNQATGSFSPSLSTVILNSPTGTKTLTPRGSHFYNLVISCGETMQLGGNLFVDNDLTIESGTLNVTTSNYNITSAGSFINNGTFTSQAGRVTFTGTGATETIKSGGSNFNELYISAGAATSYLLDTDDLSVDNNLTINSGKLDLNGKTLNFGNGPGDVLNVSGTLYVGANSFLKMADNTSLQVASGGKLYVKGTGQSTVATVSNQGSGTYTAVINSGARIYAKFYLFEYMNSQGLQVKNGAIVDNSDNFSNGTFSNCTGRYLLLENLTGNIDPVSTVKFNTGVTNNIKATSATGKFINVLDASGSRAGPVYEDDDGSATTGAVRWVFTNPILVWDGSDGTDWNDANNWSDLGTPGINTLGTPPTDMVHAMIPDAATTPSDPVLGSGADGICMNLSIESGGLLTISNNKNIQVDTLLLIEGTLTVSAGSATTIKTMQWENTGMFNCATSTLFIRGKSGTYDLISATANGAIYNLTFDNSLTDDTATYRIPNNLLVKGAFTINGGTVIFTNSAILYLYGNLTNTAGRNGKLFSSNSPIALYGSGQSISSYMTETFSDMYVYFAGTKTINSPIVLNGNMKIALSAQLVSSSSITVKGNWTNTSTSAFSGTATSVVVFAGTLMQTISRSSGENIRNITFNNSNPVIPQIVLNSKVYVVGQATFIDGVVESTSSNLISFFSASQIGDGTEAQAGNANSYISGPVSKVGSGNFTFPTGDGNIFARIKMEALGSSSTFVAQYFDNPYSDIINIEAGGISSVSDVEYWTLTRTAGTATPLFKLFWEDGVRSGIADIAYLSAVQYDGGASLWRDKQALAKTGTAGGNGTITAFDQLTGSGGPVTFGFSDVPTPVELISFEANLIDDMVKLDWATASELNNSHFIVEKTSDGENFEEVSEVPGMGNSNENVYYTTFDPEPYEGIGYYRLKQIDFNGEFSLSELVPVNYVKVNAENIVMQLTPNPTRFDNINLTILGASNTDISIEIFDLNGRLHYQSSATIDNKEFKIRLNPEYDLTAGFYLVNVTINGNLYMKKMVIR